MIMQETSTLLSLESADVSMGGNGVGVIGGGMAEGARARVCIYSPVYGSESRSRLTKILMLMTSKTDL